MGAARTVEPPRFGRLYGASTAMRQVYRLIERVAPTDSTVLVLGESGAGKEVVARTLHEKSRRAGGPFVAVNCGALPPNLIEAELFGHERGAFTGAVRSHRGYFERAAGGTLFLDEITEMAPELQVRLLRVLETGRFTPVGGDVEVAADVRVLAATNRDPGRAVREGRLREDLMYRLAVFPICLPPLRARGDDGALLAQAFLDALNRKEAAAKRLSPGSLERIRRHGWPGNVRELQNAVQRAFILADELLEVETGAALAAHGVHGDSLQFAVGTPIAEMERAAIEATLARCAGDKRRCADLLGISLKTLYNRLAEYQAAGRAQAGRMPDGRASAGRSPALRRAQPPAGLGPPAEAAAVA
jgi:DNA-binding NtrC family response regulator